MVACLLQLNAARRPAASLLLATKQLQRNMHLVDAPSSPASVSLLQTIKVRPSARPCCVAASPTTLRCMTRLML